MISPQSPRGATILWCSAALCLGLAMAIGSNVVADRTLEVKHDPMRTGQLAARFDEPAPDWLQIPGRSTKPTARNIGVASGLRTVKYRTLGDADAVMRFHRDKLAWKDLRWLDLELAGGGGRNITRVAIGDNALTGERLQITVRDLGFAQEVELKIDARAHQMAASVTAQP